MCGIAGYLGKFPPDLLGRMRDRIAHRGPDGQGCWTDPELGVGLAHRRLAIIDLSDRGLQPMWDSTRSVAITFNGEIYNYRELKRELEAGGFEFQSDCDTEVIINLYLRDGFDFISRLNGIFAFAIWDSRSRELLIVRDAMGVKPLYYASVGSGVVFASELKALLEVDGIDRSIDLNAIASYVTFLYSPAPLTMFAGVKKLLPGHALRCRLDGRQQMWSFYSLPYDQTLSKISEGEAIAQTRFFVERAVQRQMVADVPVGAFLSGGLDSSSVVAFAQRSLGAGQKLSCFTIGMEGAGVGSDGWMEDLPYAKRVAEHLGVKLETVFVAPSTEVDLEQMVYQLDEPQADPAALNTLYISQLARSCGIKVLLSGAGGDDIFTGYRRHRAVSLERYWSWSPSMARRGIKNMTALLSKRNPARRRFSKAFQYADLEGDRRIVSYFQWLSEDVLNRLFCDGSYRPSELMTESLRSLPVEVPPMNRMLYLDAKYFLTDHNLNYSDKMSMAAGIEVRVPLIDHDLVAFAARIPVDLKQRGMTGKWVFKKAMEALLPADVIYRPKTGFGVPLRTWLRGKLGGVLDGYLSEASIRRRGIFSPAAVRQLIEDDRAGRIDAGYSILALACVEMWLRRFAD